MSTLHCALENGADLYINERQKIRHYRARSAEERRKKNAIFLLRGCVLKLALYIALLYTHSIGNHRVGRLYK